MTFFKQWHLFLQYLAYSHSFAHRPPITRNQATNSYHPSLPSQRQAAILTIRRRCKKVSVIVNFPNLGIFHRSVSSVETPQHPEMVSPLTSRAKSALENAEDIHRYPYILKYPHIYIYNIYIYYIYIIHIYIWYYTSNLTQPSLWLKFVESTGVDLCLWTRW